MAIAVVTGSSTGIPSALTPSPCCSGARACLTKTGQRAQPWTTRRGAGWRKRARDWAFGSTCSS